MAKKQKNKKSKIADIKYQWKVNKSHDFDPIPKKYKKKNDELTHPMTSFGEIGIGSDNPVMKFQDWEKRYWKGITDK